ncbi:conserved exported hypothetical protein [Candidatus Desulfosporosinus infrequens]|uniref:DUF2680 domain-containing protein n=1 Tax=Candidatus Desulfosporosinus infrequens TaxID=2043169 RepID=A0A2U3K2G7_9FIRM|nr:conserved exported hypothetical protein [Candidatus Desulfosporosinus infrequens]
MKNFKKLIAAATIVGVLGMTGAVYAAVGATTPAGIVAGLTGKSVEQVTAERAAGKTYGTIASEAGKLDEFKTEILELSKANLDQRVKDGYLTQAQADTAYNTMKANQVICDGTGSARMGLGNGTGLGMGAGAGRRNGGGRGMNAGCRLLP